MESGDWIKVDGKQGQIFMTAWRAGKVISVAVAFRDGSRKWIGVN